MISRLGTPEIFCDAPPYAVVRACETLGFQSPLDVRWCRKSQSIRGQVVDITQSESEHSGAGHHVTICVWYVPEETR